MKTALITGITGQDGSYLAEHLLTNGYRVFGLVRRSSTVNFSRIDGIIDHLDLLNADLLDQSSIMIAMEKSKPDEIYNLAAQSFVPTSWDQPVLTGEFTALGVVRMLEAMRRVCPSARFYQASSSEMFGKVQEVPQTERTPFYPRSPYGVAKVYGHLITVNYRESYGLYRLRGNPVQPRIPETRARVRDAEDHPFDCPHQAGCDRSPRDRQPRCQARLGVRRRLRAGDAPDAGKPYAR